MPTYHNCCVRCGQTFKAPNVHANICMKCIPKPPPAHVLAANVVKTLVQVANGAIHGQAVAVSDEEKTRRMEICRACDQFKADTQRCMKCGCFMTYKSRLSAGKCSIGKW